MVCEWSGIGWCLSWTYTSYLVREILSCWSSSPNIVRRHDSKIVEHRWITLPKGLSNTTQLRNRWWIGVSPLHLIDKVTQTGIIGGRLVSGIWPMWVSQVSSLIYSANFEITNNFLSGFELNFFFRKSMNWKIWSKIQNEKLCLTLIIWLQKVLIGEPLLSSIIRFLSMMLHNWE